MKYIKISIFSLIISIILINSVFASSNTYIENNKDKELKIIEEYKNSYSISDTEVKILNKLLNQVEVNVKTTLNIKGGFSTSNDTLQKINNVKKTSNEEYNIKDFYVIGTSEQKENLSAYWHKIIENGNIIGEGYVKENNNFLIKREFGTGNEINEQTEPIYTTNKIINTIQNSELLKIKNLNINTLNSKSYQVSFSLSIDKSKLPEIRYIYIGHNENVSESDNITNYVSAISNEIDLNLYNSSYFENIGGGNGNGGLLKSPMLLSSPSPTSVSVSVDKIPKVDVVINNADNLNDISNIENDINTSLTGLGIDTSDILYYKKNVERYNFNDFLDKGKQDENLLSFGVSTPSSMTTFSNIPYDESTLEKLSIEDVIPDTIVHSCSFVSTYNDEYHWEYCTICGESAEILAKLKGNNISKPTDNGDNTKGNINIEAHGVGGWVNSYNEEDPRHRCNSKFTVNTCKCGITKRVKRGSYCVKGSTNSWSDYPLYYRRCSSDICSVCKEGIWENGSNESCYSSTKHFVTFPSYIGHSTVCKCNNPSICKNTLIDFKLSQVSKTSATIIFTLKQEGTYNKDPYTSFGNDSKERKGSCVISSISNENLGGGVFRYTVKYNISPCETDTGFMWDGAFIKSNTASSDLYWSGITHVIPCEIDPPAITNISISDLNIQTDVNGNTWIGQKALTISGLDGSNSVSLTIKDDNNKIYYKGNCSKNGNNFSLNITPAIEANVKKVLHCIFTDLSGNTTINDIEIDNTDCKSPEIISELDYTNEWKNKIIFKAEAYEGGVGLTQIALNLNSDFKFVDKIENPDLSGNDIYYRFYVFEGDIYGTDVITPTLFARDGLNHLDSKKILIGKLDSTKPTIENIIINNNQIEIIANDNHITKGAGSGIKGFSVVPIGKNPTLSSFKFTNNIQIDYSGDYDVYAIDNAGNVSNKYPINIMLNDDATNKLRDDAIKVFNYMDSDINDIFRNDRYIANNICTYDGNFIWLTDTNKDFYKKYINYVDGNSLKDYTHYIDNSMNYDNAVENTARYIKKLIDNEFNDNYYILGDKFNIKVNPADKKLNQVSIEYPEGMYYINHDFLYFDNTIGECNNTNMYIKDLQCDFNKVGKFDINYCDETMCDLYIHRKPFIDFSIHNDSGNLSLTNNTFDLDDDTDNGFGKGIKEEHWYWKYPTDTSWHNEKPTTYENDKIVLVKLEVKDNQNYKDKLIKVLGLNDIFASFYVEKQQVSKGENIKVYDTSYDSCGNLINNWNYEFKRNGVFIASSSEANPQFNTNSVALGTYTLFLQVKNELGDISNTYSKQLIITDDNDNPYIIAIPPNCYRTTKQDIILNFYDLGAGVKQYKYVFTNEKRVSLSGYCEWIETSSDVIYTPSDYGTYYLSVIVEDNNGNQINKCFGAYTIYKENIPKPPSSRGGGGGNGGETFSQAYLDSLKEKPIVKEKPIEEPIKPVYKEKIKKKDLFELLYEIYRDFKDNNNIVKGKKYDIMDLIKGVYEDFNKNKDNNDEEELDIVDIINSAYNDLKTNNNLDGGG